MYPCTIPMLFQKLSRLLLRGLSIKYEDTVNTEANTSNNKELFLFVLLRTIWQFIYEFSFQYVNSEIKY